MQRLQRHDRRHPRGRQQRPAHTRRGEQVGVPGVGEQLGAVRGQEREHAARRDQVPGHRLRVGRLPVHLLETLHEIIIAFEHRIGKYAITCWLFSRLLGRDAALEIARHLVVFLRRPGNQAQFSAQLAGQLASREPLRDVQRWIADHPAADLSVETLASQASLSPRQFARAFAAEVGMPPGRYVDRVRLETARRRLEDTADGVEQTAQLLRVRHAGGDAPRLPAHPRRQPRRVPPPLPHRRRHLTRGRHLTRRRVMQIAILLFDRFTVLDAIGPYQVLSSLPGARGRLRRRTSRARSGTSVGSLILSAEAGLPDVPHPDVIVVPRRSRPERPDAGRARARVAQGRRPDERLDHLGVHRIAHPGRGRAADRPPRDHALAGPGRARSPRRDTGQRAGGRPTEST